VAYGPISRSTFGCIFFHVIRNAQARITSQQFSNTPFHFFSSDDQQRSIGLYLLWYGG
jgi:hypothetical protein